MSERGRISFLDIKSEIERRVAARIWSPGETIPGEEALAAEFGASRTTVNRALQELAREGLVERRRKAGTRIAEHRVREARFAIPLIRHEIEAKGATYAYRLLAREAGPAPDLVAARLDLPSGSPMLHVRCLHMADRIPYQYEDRWISLETVPEARDETFDRTGPNEWLVANAPFSRAEFIFLAARASAEEAGLLHLGEGDAIFVGERLTWILDRPVTLVRMVHPPSHRMVTRI